MSEKDASGRRAGDPSASSPAADRVEADHVGADGDHHGDDHLERLRDLVADLDEVTVALVEHGVAHDLPAIEYNARRIRDTVRILEGNVPEERPAEDDPAGTDATDERSTDER